MTARTKRVNAWLKPILFVAGATLRKRLTMTSAIGKPTTKSHISYGTKRPKMAFPISTLPKTKTTAVMQLRNSTIGFIPMPG